MVEEVQVFQNANCELNWGLPVELAPGAKQNEHKKMCHKKDTGRNRADIEADKANDMAESKSGRILPSSEECNSASMPTQRFAWLAGRSASSAGLNSCWRLILEPAVPAPMPACSRSAAAAAKSK